MDCEAPATAAARPSPAGPQPLHALMALSQKHQAAAPSPLQPAVRALLMHPPGADAGDAAARPLPHPSQLMVPVGGLEAASQKGEREPQQLTCAASLAAAPSGSGASWLMGSVPLSAQPQQRHPQQSPLLSLLSPSGVFAAAAPLPPPQPWQLSMQAMAQQQAPRAGLPEPNCSGSGSGSVGASDGTTVFLRSSFDSTSSVLQPPLGPHAHAPVCYPAFLLPQPPLVYAPAAAGVARPALASSAEAQWALDAPSDCSDVEDERMDERLDRQHSQAQVGARRRGVCRTAHGTQLAAWAHPQPGFYASPHPPAPPGRARHQHVCQFGPRLPHTVQQLWLASSAK